MSLARCCVLALCAAFLLILPTEKTAIADAKANPEVIPGRYGIALTAGHSYDPTGDVTFTQVSGFALFDHETIFPFKGPAGLRCKIESSLGSVTSPERRVIASANIVSLYYMEILATKGIRPYIEGGIGGIYTDYKFNGQGTRFNFNPLLGLGAEISAGPAGDFLAALRLFHLSNAGLHRRNRGMNAVTFSVGRFF